ncbi:hypothetical protein OAF09_00415 [bacterium]|nr:hypothetical protein [bacterium]MDC0278655.1 hypothetical protein [bacterium]
MRQLINSWHAAPQVSRQMFALTCCFLGHEESHQGTASQALGMLAWMV